MERTIKTPDGIVVDLEFLNKLINSFNKLGHEQGVLNVKKEELDRQLDCFLHDMWIQATEIENKSDSRKKS